MKIRRYGTLFFALCLMVLTGCSGSKSDNVVTGKYYNPANATASTDETVYLESSDDVIENDEQQIAAAGDLEQEKASGTDAIAADLFLITSNDMQAQCLVLEQLASGKQYMYNYTLVTRFLDKYGNRASVSYFEPGRVITIGEKDSKGYLLEAQISNEVWEYPDITKYAVDDERGVFTIGDVNYSYEKDVFIHSDGTIQKISDLNGLDTLRVVGMDKEIISVVVTTGHGILKLKNTDLFEGSFIQVGTSVFAEITKDMELELPEGKHTVAVANNGYGDTAEIEIVRGEELVLDLDTLKGEGPKVGNVLFAVDVQGAIIMIDGEAIDYSQVVPITFGVHSLKVMAEGYETYSKKLFVNSKEATIVIAMSGDTSSSSSTTDSSTGTTSTDTNSSTDTSTNTNSSSSTGSTSTQSNQAGSLAGSLAGSQSTSDSTGTGANTSSDITSATSDAEIDAIVNQLLGEDDDDDDSTDYLTTLTEILSELTGDD